MELKQLEIFRIASQELNFTRTAKILGYAQSSITENIKNLEVDIGVPLFERFGKRIALTESGKQFKSYADRILSLAEEAKEVVGGIQEPSGVLTICASETQCTYRLPLLLRQFQTQYPKVQLSFLPGISEEEFEDLLNQGRLDVALLSMTPVESKNLVVEELMPEPIVIICHPNHALAKKTEVKPEDLAQQSLLVTEDCDYRRAFENALLKANAQPASKLELRDIEAIKQCVMAGVGIAALPKIAVEKEVKDGRLAILNWVGPDFPIVIQLSWHKDKWMSPALKGFLDLTREVILGSKRE